MTGRVPLPEKRRPLGRIVRTNRVTIPAETATVHARKILDAVRFVRDYEESCDEPRCAWLKWADSFEAFAIELGDAAMDVQLASSLGVDDVGRVAPIRPTDLARGR